MESLSLHVEAGWKFERPKKENASWTSFTIRAPSKLCDAAVKEDDRNQALREGLGLTTKPDACDLWLEGRRSMDSKKPNTADKRTKATTHALWVFIGAISGARLASSSLMDDRWMPAFLDICEKQISVLSKELPHFQKLGGPIFRAYVEFLEYVKVHIAAVRDTLSFSKDITAESAIYLNANLDAVYYDLLQFHLRSGGYGIAIPPPHMYFPALVLSMPGSGEAAQDMIENKIAKRARKQLVKTWGLEKTSQGYQLPDDARTGNPLLQVIWSRFQEGSRLCADLDSTPKGQPPKYAEPAITGKERPSKRRKLGDAETQAVRKGTQNDHKKKHSHANSQANRPESSDSSSSEDSSSDSSSDDSDGDTDTSHDDLDSDDDLDSNEVEDSDPKAWPGHSALRAFRESGKECHFYAYAPPTRSALKAIKRVAGTLPVVEIGAGLGYWAKSLQDTGMRVVPFDISPPGPSAHAVNDYHGWLPTISSIQISRGGPKMLARFGKKAVAFLCYPPPDSPMAMDCLKHFRGSFICVVGEWQGDTGTSDFTSALLRDFSLFKRVPLPNWSDTAHELTIWQKRPSKPASEISQPNNPAPILRDTVEGSNEVDLKKEQAETEAPEFAADLSLYSCTACGKSPNQLERGTKLRRCIWTKSVTYCSSACAEHDMAHHKDILRLRWIQLKRIMWENDFEDLHVDKPVS